MSISLKTLTISAAQVFQKQGCDQIKTTVQLGISSVEASHVDLHSSGMQGVGQ